MNIIDFNIIKSISNEGFSNQRELSNRCSCSLGAVNKSVKNLITEEYLSQSCQLLPKAKALLNENKPENAIILAAGYGMRMVPINTESPKALLSIKGEVLIERLIEELHEEGISDISIVVGYMKEKFEYLIDKYNVKLVVNSLFNKTNTLASLALCKDKIHNSYIIPGDLWFETNPFSKNEINSWYMVKDNFSSESNIKISRNKQVEFCKTICNGNTPVGLAYVNAETSTIVKNIIEKQLNSADFNTCFWEDILCGTQKIFYAKTHASGNVYEINTYEQLREIDGYSDSLNSNAIDIICECLNVKREDIKDITVSKKGMTNRSFLFTCKGQKYIMRIPGKGTNNLINRYNEAATYSLLKGKGICDEVLYLNPDNGYKITKFINDSRVCSPDDEADLKLCFNKLKEFHSLKLQADHYFDIFGQIEYYESLWDNQPSVYGDYEETKSKVYELKEFIDSIDKTQCLTHIDAVPDNFLIFDGKVRLIDWEYAGMQDPHVDIAMFCIYALYDKKQIDRIINIYFNNQCDRQTRLKVYCYISCCGLLWSNWCEYKRNLGIEFGEYSLKQYRYAKDFYRIVKNELKEDIAYE